jgi:hypothetical protein
MKRLAVLIYGIAACVLALAGFLYAIGLAGAVTIAKSTAVGGASPWPSVLLSAVVLLTGLAALTHLVAQPGERASPQSTSDLLSPISIAIICCLGLLASLCVAFFGGDPGTNHP